jgi:hypothetical protein
MTNQSIDYKCVLADLKARRERFVSSIKALDAAIAGIEPLVIDQETAVADGGMGWPNVPPIQENIYRRMTIKDAALHVIETSGPVSTTVITKALKNGGIKSKSKNLYRTIYNTLKLESGKENSTISKDGPLWGMKERAIAVVN